MSNPVDDAWDALVRAVDGTQGVPFPERLEEMAFEWAAEAAIWVYENYPDQPDTPPPPGYELAGPDAGGFNPSDTPPADGGAADPGGAPDAGADPGSSAGDDGGDDYSGDADGPYAEPLGPEQ